MPSASDIVNKSGWTVMQAIFETAVDPQLAEDVAKAIVAWRGQSHNRRRIHSTLELRHIIDSVATAAKAEPATPSDVKLRDEHDVIDKLDAQRSEAGSKNDWSHRRGRFVSSSRREREVNRLAGSKPDNSLAVAACFQVLRVCACCCSVGS